MAVSIMSFAFDEHSSFSKGPAKAPAEIIKALTKGSLNKGTENGELITFDENVFLLPAKEILSGEAYIESISSQISQQIDKGRKPLSLGGDHSISFPIIKALHQHYGRLNIIHVDAHSDLYDEFKGNKYSNACPFARVMEQELASSLHQFGIRTLTQHQVEQADRFGVNVYQMKDWPTKLPHLDGPVYLSIDVDGIDPAFAPGVSHREPGGLTSREVINLIHQIEGPLVGADIVEFNPEFDVDGITANLSAKLVKECLGKLLETN